MTKQDILQAHIAYDRVTAHHAGYAYHRAFFSAVERRLPDHECRLLAQDASDVITARREVGR